MKKEELKNLIDITDDNLRCLYMDMKEHNKWLQKMVEDYCNSWRGEMYARWFYSEKKYVEKLEAILIDLLDKDN